MSMPGYFLDSNALVKRYHREAGTSWVQATCAPRKHPLLYISQLAQVEVVAALRQTGRLNGEQPAYINTLVNTFERHVALSARPDPIYHILQVTDAVTRLAATLCNKYWEISPGPLRSLDAIQLASALLASASRDDEVILVTSDTRLAAVAAFEGLRIVNPAYPPTPRT
jgi:predicted nucleic acid-binding protein